MKTVHRLTPAVAKKLTGILRQPLSLHEEFQHPVAEDFKYVTAEDLAKIGLEPCHLLETPFYDGTETISTGNGYHKLVHVIQETELAKFCEMSWQQYEQWRKDRQNSMEIGG